MKTPVKFMITLGIVGVITGFALALVYKVTLPIIQSQDLKALQSGLESIFPGDNDFEKLSTPLQSPDQTIKIGDAYVVKQNETTVGLVITVTTPGSQAPITLLIGVRKDGTISGVRVISMSETAGLGANADNPNYFVDKERKITFLGQFVGKNPNTDPFIAKQDIISITGATITSTAISNGVKIGGKAAYEYLQGGGL